MRNMPDPKRTKSNDAQFFSNSAKKTKKINLPRLVGRGGTRL